MKNKPLDSYFKLNNSKTIPPIKAHDDDVGFDLSIIALEKYYEDSNVYLYTTGLIVEPPDGFYWEVVPRSSIWKKNIRMVNNVGIIDPSYRGEILVPLIHTDNKPFTDDDYPIKVVQLILRPLFNDVNFIHKSEFSKTDRNDSGFGSTDKG